MKRVLTIVSFTILGFINNSQAQVEEVVIKNKTETSNEDYSDAVIVCEEVAEFPGGQLAFIDYINKNLVYPKNEQEKGISGTVLVEFIVNKEGEIKNVKVIRGIKDGKALEEEAKRLIKSMPNWKPARGTNFKTGSYDLVNYKLTFPIKFALENKK